ncbi:MAG: hypothetical protein P8175_11315 [Deltaproteobacteria bacterium]
MAKKGNARELENVADFFISSKEKDEDPGDGLNELVEEGDQREAEFELEETVSVRKRIAFSDGEKAQDHIKRCLLEHLEGEYQIHRIELRKNTGIEMPGNKKRTKEEVLIVLKESSPG